ncbi:hypothetical protein BT93_H0853 [Corymbia citriodora subsp. variegata]|nr:hypothetical protein BT93_H0853 [Corymbia citriodora subsp. variegata]
MKKEEMDLHIVRETAKDHKYQFYRNIYHHSLGYTILVLSILDVSTGIDIPQSDD